MTSQAEIGNLRVRLGIDSAEFANGVRGVQQSLATLTNSLKAFATGAAAITLFNKAVDALHDVADMGDLADAIGVTATQLQVYNRLAAASHASSESMAKGLESVAEQSTNAKSALAKLFDANGLSMKGKSINDIMLTFMDLLKNAKTPAEQLAMATGVLGERVGRQLVEALRNGSSGWKDAFGEMQASGVALSDSQVAQAQRIEEEYNKVIANLTTLWEKFAVAVAQAMDAAVNPPNTQNILNARNAILTKGTRYGVPTTIGGIPLTPGADGKGDLPGNVNLGSGGTLAKPTANPFDGVDLEKLDKIKKAVVDTGEVADNSDRQFAALWDEMSAGMDMVLPEAQALTDAYLGLADVLSTDLSDALAGLVSGTESVQQAFTQMAQSIARDLEQLAAQLLKSSIMQLLQYLPGILAGGGGAGFNFGGMTFGGLYADGGHLGSGKWGIAGEAGPEIVHGPANITPMDGSGGQGSPVNIQIYNNSSANVSARRQQDGSVKVMVEEIVSNALARGGNKIDAALASGYGLRRSGR